MLCENFKVRINFYLQRYEHCIRLSQIYPSWGVSSWGVHKGRLYIHQGCSRLLRSVWKPHGVMNLLWSCQRNEIHKIIKALSIFENPVMNNSTTLRLIASSRKWHNILEYYNCVIHILFIFWNDLYPYELQCSSIAVYMMYTYIMLQNHVSISSSNSHKARPQLHSMTYDHSSGS